MELDTGVTENDKRTSHSHDPIRDSLSMRCQERKTGRVDARRTPRDSMPSQLHQFDFPVAEQVSPSCREALRTAPRQRCLP